MANDKFTAGIAVAFAAQSAEGTFSTTLSDAITTQDSVDITAAEGLLLGDAEAGVFESGLTYTFGRVSRDKGRLAGGVTRPISDFLSDEASTFTFAFPFCGNRSTVATIPPVAADVLPLAGIQALLAGAFMTAITPVGVTQTYKLSTGTLPFSAAIWFNGVRHEWKDCRTALSIVFEAQSIPICTATIQAGSSNGATHNVASALPSGVGSNPGEGLIYGDQALVSAPSVKEVANQWGDVRGYDSLTLDVAPTFEDIGDSNAETGVVKEISDVPVDISTTLYKSDAAAPPPTGGKANFEELQVVEELYAGLTPLSFFVDPAAAADLPITSVGINMPAPEAQEATLANLGTKAASSVTLRGRNDTVNEEIQIIFR